MPSTTTPVSPLARCPLLFRNRPSRVGWGYGPAPPILLLPLMTIQPNHTWTYNSAICAFARQSILHDEFTALTAVPRHEDPESWAKADELHRRSKDEWKTGASLTQLFRDSCYTY